MFARLFLIISGTAGFLIFAIALAVDWDASVVVRDDDGQVVFRSELPSSGEFGIEYVHSYYSAPALERFLANPQGGFELVGISSPSEAVLDYYEIEGRKEETDSGWVRLVPKERQRFEELALTGTATGRKTLILPDRRVPLFSESGDPVHLVLRIEEDTLLTEVVSIGSGDGRLTGATTRTMLARKRQGKDKGCPTSGPAKGRASV